ncbi:SixA phosphatase family protein [Flavobacterium ponti]|jgi:phosphohistidine phosphatase|uniref:SixA phosphatase family protein n=1 Tax=Flavobacterium ponti TaxID=665133 RepID=A0ABV9P361_9FLAO
MLLILIRHAKSSWENNFIDHDRPLSNRGVKDAQLVFNSFDFFLNNKCEILASTSKRTTQTAKIFCSLTKINFEDVIFKKELYTFDSNELEKVIRKNLKKNLIIFGHNNAITDFVNKFGNYYIENVPTCGVVIIKFDDFSTFSPNKGVITKTIFPRDLK